MFVCVDIIVVSINAEKHKQFVERLMLGKFNSTWGDLRTKQFKGSVSNIQVIKYFDPSTQLLSIFSFQRCMRERAIWNT